MAENPASLANLWQRADDLAAAIVNVRILHQQEGVLCRECHLRYPCRTIRALDGENVDEQEG